MLKDKIDSLFFPHDLKPDHFKALDGLRGIAVLFVLLSHSSNADIYIHDWLNFQKVGKTGVYLFFVLSAYLLDRQIALAFIEKKSNSFYWKYYFLRRFLRIYPLFFIGIIFHGIWTLCGIQTVIDEFMDLPLHMLLLKGESIFWSIPVEFKYYFISPIIMFVCHKYLKWDSKKLFLFFLGSIFFTIALELAFRLPLTSTFKYFPVFLVGTMISIYELLSKDDLLKYIKRPIINILGNTSFLLILISTPFYFNLLFGFEVNFHASLFYFPYAVAWGILLIYAKYGTGILKQVFEFKFLRFIGTISFSMYLFHMPILKFVETLNFPEELKFYLFFLLVIIVSCCTYLLIEKPLSKIRLKKN
ncbi:MAG: acyltransferase [Crocinitomicaceae bacterium]|nr:acyltransferase [Crocinitomicaceae bacterium]